MAWHRQDQASQCLTTIPGVGPIGGVSFTLKVPDPKAFRSGRHFAAWIGITPGENSTGGKHRPGRISRQGDETLRRLLVLGATAIIKQAKPGRTAPWLLGLLARQPKKLAAVALANKMARIIWAMPASSGPCPHHLGHARIIWAMPASSGPCPHHLGHDGERRGLPETAAGMRRSPPYPVSGGSSGACKERSEMAIGRSEDRDTPRNPAMLRHRVLVRDPIRETHLGQRSRRPHHKSLPSQKRGAGHMTATDQTRRSCTALARRGPSTYGFRARGRCPRPGMTDVDASPPCVLRDARCAGSSA